MPTRADGVENALSGGDRAREGRHRAVDSRLEMQDVAAQEEGKAIGDRGIAHVFLRASIMMVDPARQAASMTVKGSAASASAP